MARWRGYLTVGDCETGKKRYARADSSSQSYICDETRVYGDLKWENKTIVLIFLPTFLVPLPNPDACVHLLGRLVAAQLWLVGWKASSHPRRNKPLNTSPSIFLRGLSSLSKPGTNLFVVCLVVVSCVIPRLLPTCKAAHQSPGQLRLVAGCGKTTTLLRSARPSPVLSLQDSFEQPSGHTTSHHTTSSSHRRSFFSQSFPTDTDTLFVCRKHPCPLLAARCDITSRGPPPCDPPNR